MIQTTTLAPSESNQLATEKPREISAPESAEPSALTLMNILNYSRNLDVTPSALVNSIEFIRS